MAARRRGRRRFATLTPLRGRRLARAAVVTVLLVALSTLGMPPAAQAAGAGVVVSGEGYGHGIGMSQYGAQGRAQAGHTYTAILQSYYPGTTLTTGSDTTTLRVLVTGDVDGSTTVRAESGMTIHAGSRSATLPATVSGSAPTLWRIRLVSGALRVEAFAGGSWRSGGTQVDAVVSGGTSAELRAPDGTLQLQLGGDLFREYRGQLRAVRATTTTLQTVVLTRFADYLPSVVASEMPSSWHAQALAAQAVAARSYALRERHSRSTHPVNDTCDSTSCQVFNGLADYNAAGSRIRSWTAPSTVTATTSTAGRYLAYGGIPAFTQFSASNGGYSVAGSQPYLRAAPDPFDGYPRWNVALTGTEVAEVYPSIGNLRSIATVRDGNGAFGGRVTSATLTGSSGSITVTGTQLRQAFGLRSTLIDIRVEGGAGARDFTGDGWPDVLARSTSGLLFRWSGRPDGSLGSRVEIGHGWNIMGAMTIGTGLGASGVAELVAVDSRTSRLMAYPANGAGGVGRPRVVGSGGWNAMDVVIVVTGFTGAGSAGLMARNATTGRLYYYPSNGEGGLGRAQLIGGGWLSMRIVLGGGDWDENGTPDLMAVDTSGRLMLYPGDGSGGFARPRQIGNNWGSMVTLVGGADSDGDGHLDLLAKGADGQLWLYPGAGSGSFGSRRLIGHGWSSFDVIS